MRFEMRITCKNAAFEDGNQEISRLLRRAADDLESSDDGLLFDINGNYVGDFELIEEINDDPA